MARKPSSSASTIRARLTAASAKLTQSGEPELAAAVDEVLAPGGWGVLRRAEAAVNPASAGERNLAVQLTETARDLIKERAADRGNTITNDVNEAFTKFLAGEFLPSRPQRSPRNSGVTKVNLNSRPDGALRAQVETAAKERAEELGWEPKPAHIAADWLMKKYRIPAAAKTG
ncbi:hypothetical protein [Streptomyces alfalfae]